MKCYLGMCRTYIDSLMYLVVLSNLETIYQTQSPSSLQNKGNRKADTEKHL